MAAASQRGLATQLSLGIWMAELPWLWNSFASTQRRACGGSYLFKQVSSKPVAFLVVCFVTAVFTLGARQRT